jgi:hypothetical protein
LWDVATGWRLGPPLRHHQEVYAVAFRPDGRAVLTGSRDKTARQWRLPPPLAGDPDRITCWLQVLTGMELDEREALRLLDAGSWQERRRQLQEWGGPPNQAAPR